MEKHERELQPVARRIREHASNAVSDGRSRKSSERSCVTPRKPIWHISDPSPIPHPDNPRGEWITLAESLTRSLGDDVMPPHVVAYNDIVQSFGANSRNQFNGHVHSLLTWLKDHFPEATKRAEVEAVFNRLDLFGKSAALYRGGISRSLRFVAGVAAHVAPNGDSSLARGVCGPHDRLAPAYVYPGATARDEPLRVGDLCRLGRRRRRRLILNAFNEPELAQLVAAMIGFLTLVIALNLGAEGDTVEVMRAVLDSNFWLATHVVVITIGYSATFVAGALAAVGLIRGLNNAGSVYGVTCFALLFSFVGTILGGIWADQSWGRFWGWDPKENGALLIVLWNAVLLHLRWGRLAGRSRADGVRGFWKRDHKLFVVWRQHAGRRTPFLRVYGRRALLAGNVRAEPARDHGSGVCAASPHATSNECRLKLKTTRIDR